MFIFLFHVLGYDAWFYLSHLLLHTRLGWRIHKVHHEKRIPTALDTYHDHWFESVFQSLGYFLPFLFGIWAPYQLAAALVFVNARRIARHDPRTVRWIGNHHLLHHLHPQYNFGDYWIDRLCGTSYPSGEEVRRGLVHL